MGEGPYGGFVESESNPWLRTEWRYSRSRWSDHYCPSGTWVESTANHENRGTARSQVIWCVVSTPVRDIVAPSMLHSIWTLYTNLPSHELQKLLCIFGCWYTSRFLVYALKELTLKESDRIILWISTCLLKKCIFATTERPEGEWFLDDTCRHFQYLSRNWVDSTKTSVFIYKLFSWWANGAYIVQLLQLFVVSLLLMINDGLNGFLWRMGIVHLWDWL